ncbi:hypothetical protein TSUD_105440 [Trifolium subterraneum]|uniref:Reverse transcriptase domain-containing protein n=1 Tax=Trifolium subterraneum TaxID=3900 RepID=A0A2Z6LIN5_TRISU|nr:hypothetical protein TSUD_105440 [Trifolium subterraneum]
MDNRVPAEARITNLEDQMNDVKSMLKTLIEKMHEQNLSIAAGSKQSGKAAMDPVSDESSGGSSQAESRLAWKKVKLPVFEGEDPVAWITRAEIYFDLQNTPDELKVKLSRLSMEGPTIHWFNLLMETEDELSWEKLKRALIARYGGRRLENPFEELSTLRQKGDVEEYVEAFELVSSQVGRLPEEQYLGYFMSGLKPAIRRRVRTMNPRSRMEMMRIVKDVEEELREEDDDVEFRFKKKSGYERVGSKDWVGSVRNRSGSFLQDPLRSIHSSGSNLNPKAGSSGSNTRSTASFTSTTRKGEGTHRSDAIERGKGVRSLSNEEFEERRAKDGEIVCLEEVAVESDEENEVECKSMGVLGSIGETNTMKVAGKIQNVDLLVLIDSGASHNFISPKVTIALGLKITPTAVRYIKLGDGHKVLTQGVCEELKMKLGEMELVVDVFVLELGGMDMVLGVAWLSTLGKVIRDWRSMTMQFSYNNKIIKLQETSKSETPIDLLPILEKFHEVFKEHIQLPPMRSQTHQIKLYHDHEEINVRPYRYPHHQKEEIERQVAELLEAGVIGPSMSSFSSPVILVKKKDKSWRMCVDYRALNKATIPDKYPIPIVDELLDELFGSTVFSKIDLKSGYHQIRMHENDIAKTAFRTHNGHYEYLVMPFGLMNAPATFQATMNDLFRPYLRKFVLVFFDDILVFSKNMTEHQNHLQVVLAVLVNNCFVANKGKCQFGSPQVDYLGHIISGKGVAVDPTKIQCVVDWPKPKKLTKKDNFKWGVEADQAFDLMKKIMTSAPVLILPNFEIPFEVECDAAGREIGAVLMQQKQPIAYFSKALSDGNLSKSVYEKELMALRQKYSATTPGGLLQPLPIPNNIWEDLSLDFITGLPKSRGYDAILVVVDDSLSKYSHFILLKHPYTARTIAELFVKEVGTKLKMSSAYHPETDGQTEVINRCLESYLRCFVADHPKTWSVWVAWAEFWFMSNESKVAVVAVELAERDEALRQLKTHLTCAQEQMMRYANKKRIDLSFEVGEWVFLKLRPHRQHSVVKRIHQKLAARFFGPFQIIEKIGVVAYKLKLSDESKIHPIFHVSLLKRVVGHVDIHQSLIQWKNKAAEDITWEDNEFLRGQFPDFSLEDKTFSEEEGIDRSTAAEEMGLGDYGPRQREWKVYSRKRTKKNE